MALGAEWVWVAATRIRSVGRSIRAATRALIASQTSVGSMQESTTAMASVTSPSASTRQRANSGSSIRSLRASRNPPLRMAGSSTGEISTAAAPAWKVASARRGNGRNRAKAARRIFMAS